MNSVLAPNGASTPVFIFGEMRSGTNMLTECFDRSLATEVYNESDDEAFDGYRLLPNEKVAKLIDRSSATHVIFKSLADSGRAAELLQRFPGSIAIWIYRKHTDVVNSAIRKWDEHRQYLAYILHDEKKADWRAINVTADTRELIAHHLERNISDESARALIWYFRNCYFFEQELQSDDRVFVINYEELVTSPVSQLENACRFIGLEFKERYVGHVSAGSIDRFPAPDIDMEIATLCAELRQRLDMTLADKRKLVARATGIRD